MNPSPASGGREPPVETQATPQPEAENRGLTPPARQIPKGALLGIDYGTVRVGLAVCDTDRIIASPLDTYTLRSTEVDAAYFTRVATEHRAVGLVVGLPLHAGGEESNSSAAAREYGAWLAGVTGLPVVFWDERFTTSLAEDALLGAKLSNKKRKARRDRVAAQMILQSYIDAGSPPAGTTAPE